MADDVKKNVVVNVQGKDDGASSLMDKLAAKAKAINKENRLSGETALEGMLRGGLGKFGVEALGGGAALIGIDYAAKSIDKFADKARDIKALMADGAGAGEIADNLARAIPIYGELYAAGRKLREEITGEAEAIRATNAEAAGMLKYYDLRLQASNKEREGLQKINEELRKMKVEYQNIGANPFAAAQNSLQSELDAIRDPQNQRTRLKKVETDLGVPGLEAALKTANENKLAADARVEAMKAQIDRAKAMGVPLPVGDLIDPELTAEAGKNKLIQEGAAKALADKKVAAAAQEKKLSDQKIEELEKRLAENTSQGSKSFADTIKEASDRATAARRQAAGADADYMMAFGETQAGFDAKMKLMAEDFAKKKQDAIDRAEKTIKDKKLDDVTANEVREAAYEEVAAIAAAEGIARKKARDERAESVYEKQREEAGLMLDLLTKRGQLGDAEAKRQADILEIEKKYTAELREQDKILNNPNLTKDEREAAERRKKLIGQNRALDLAQLKYNQEFGRFNQATFTAGAQESRFGGTSATDSILEKQMAEERAYRDKSLQAMLDTVTNTGKIVEALTKNPTVTYSGTGKV